MTPVNRGKPYIALTPTLEIAQSNHDVAILNAIIQFFGYGYLKPKYDINNLEAAKASRIVNRLVINQHSVIIDFFDKYPRRGASHPAHLQPKASEVYIPNAWLRQARLPRPPRWKGHPENNHT